VLLATQDIKNRIEVDLGETLQELNQLNDPGDFLVLNNGTTELRAAGPSNGVFFVQFEDRETKVLLECSDTCIQDLERYIRQFYESDISFLYSFQKPTKAWWPFAFLAVFVFIAIYEFAT